MEHGLIVGEDIKSAPAVLDDERVPLDLNDPAQATPSLRRGRDDGNHLGKERAVLLLDHAPGDQVTCLDVLDARVPDAGDAEHGLVVGEQLERTPPVLDLQRLAVHLDHFAEGTHSRRGSRENPQRTLILNHLRVSGKGDPAGDPHGHHNDQHSHEQFRFHSLSTP